MFRRIAFSGILLSFIFFSVSGNNSAFAQQCESVPSGYERDENEKYADVLIKKIADLEQQIQEISENLDRDDEAGWRQNNFASRAYFLLRRDIDPSEFQSAFRALRYSACLRKDLRDIESAMGALPSQINQIANSQRSADIRSQFKTLQGEVKNFRTCSSQEPTPGEQNVYFAREYLRSECEAVEKVTKEAFDQLRQKIASLELNSLKTWGLSEWKNLGSTENLARLRTRAQARARSWTDQNNIVRVLGAEQFFEPGREKDADESPQLDAAKKELEERQERKISREALSTESAQIAFLQASAVEVNTDRMRQDVLQELQNIPLATSSTDASEYFRAEIESSTEHVIRQREMIETFTKALRQFLNKQAQNQG